MKDSIQTMTTLATYPKELLLLIAGNLAPADVACFHLANKHIHSILRRLDFRCDLMEGADDSQDDLLSVRRERRSLMKRLRGSIPEEFDYCSKSTSVMTRIGSRSASLSALGRILSSTRVLTVACRRSLKIQGGILL